MVGKLTWYKATSSIVCALMDEGEYFNKQTCLKRAIDDKYGIPSDFKSTNRMATGDLLEPVLIKEGARRLGITDIDVDIDYKIEHPLLPLEASLDGLANAKDIIVKEDADTGIFLPHATKLTLNGQIPIECKVSSQFPQSEPPTWLGVHQLMSSMEILDAEYGILIVLWQGTDFRIYVYKRQPDYAQKLKEVVLDFDRRVEEEDWYIPECSEDAYMIFDTAREAESVMILEEDVVEDIDQYMTLKDVAAQAEKAADLCLTNLMVSMGNHSKARSADYKVDWGVRNYKATEEKIVPAKEARSIRLKKPIIKRIS
jgi:hypothetical protein